MKSSLFDLREVTDQENKTFVSQNNHTLLINLDGRILAKQGSMVAYQGDVDFKFSGGGMTRMLKKIGTGENLKFMEVVGRGDVFLADHGAQVHIVELENEELTINGPNLLAFEETLDWDIKLVKGGIMGMMSGGLFNATIKGSGLAAISSRGRPFVLEVDQPTFVDVNSIIAWTSSLNVDIKSTLKAGSFIGRGSGEAFQMMFTGQGSVVVQPGELPMAVQR